MLRKIVEHKATASCASARGEQYMYSNLQK